MVVKNGKLIIHATMMNPEEMMKKYPDENFEYDKCMVCGKPIEKIQREPRGLIEKIKAKWLGKRFWSWSVAAYYGKKIVCERSGCYSTFIWEQAEKRNRA